MTTDPLLRALEEANPVPQPTVTELPPLGPLPSRRRPLPIVVAAVVLALAAITGFALAPASTPGSDEVLDRAFAAGEDSVILYWRMRTDEPGLGTFTDDVWIHVRGDGTIDRVHELRLDGDYAGMESVITRPFELPAAETRTRSGPDAPIRVGKGIGMPDLSFTGVVATAERAARGELDVGDAVEVTYEGRDAYEIRLRENAPDPIGETRNPSELSVTLWIDRETSKPLAVRWGEGAERWRTGRLLAFERLADEARTRAQLDF